MPTENTLKKTMQEQPQSRAGQPEALQERPAVAPAVDIFENQDEVLLLADLPGVENDGVNLSLEGGQLTLEGRRRGFGERTPIAAEFRPVDFRRTFLVPDGIAADRIAAELKQGVLWVHLPKTEPLKPRRIAVKS